MSIDETSFSRSPESEIPPIVTPVLYNLQTKQKGVSTITLDKQLGKGGYGTVYLCRNENNEELAVKCIKTKDFGIPSLIEASIMSVTQHPNLAQALKIHSTPQKLYIVQELAISDLRVYRLNNQISEELCYHWVYDIAQGLSCLHRHNLIHGDLKASNILIYNGNKIKITDFTLSTNKKWNNNYRPCTPTHRPLEVWLGDKWDESVDIWAFGCTIFEIVYGATLFVNQNRDASINALIDWYNYLPRQYRSPDFSISKREVFHYTFSLPTSFNISNPQNSLILSTLIISPKGRPTIDEIMKNEIFTGRSTVPSTNISTPVTVLLPKTEAKVRKSLTNILTNKCTIELAYDLYTRLTGMINANDKIKLITCAWIAHKMVERENISLALLPFELHEILQMERIICNYLSYRLYCKSTQVVFRENKT
jgi:serine/threonine protein kinase